MRYSNLAMPILEDLVGPSPASLVVKPSLAMELFGAALVLRTGRKAPAHPLFDPENPKAAELTRRVRELWPNEMDCFSELLIVAHAGGLLFEQDAGRLLARLADAAQLDVGDLALASEAAEDRAQLLAHLDGLRRKPALRRRWVSLFADLWEEMREVWEAEGLAQVEDA